MGSPVQMREVVWPLADMLARRRDVSKGLSEAPRAQMLQRARYLLGKTCFGAHAGPMRPYPVANSLSLSSRPFSSAGTSSTRAALMMPAVVTLTP